MRDRERERNKERERKNGRERKRKKERESAHDRERETDRQRERQLALVHNGAVEVRDRVAAADVGAGAAHVGDELAVGDLARHARLRVLRPEVVVLAQVVRKVRCEARGEQVLLGPLAAGPRAARALNDLRGQRHAPVRRDQRQRRRHLEHTLAGALRVKA